MRFKSACALIALALASAAPALAQPTEPASASASPSAASSAVPPAPADKGQVVFFRKSSFIGMPYWTNVREQDVAYGKLTNGTYFVQTFDPGVHQFKTSVLGKDEIKMQIDPGETYYVQGVITVGVVNTAIVLEPSDAASFEQVFKGMKLAKPDAAKPEAAAK
jgi:hypothetical protein